MNRSDTKTERLEREADQVHQFIIMTECALTASMTSHYTARIKMSLYSRILTSYVMKAIMCICFIIVLIL